MADNADKQKRWLQAIFMNGVATGYALCLTMRVGMSPDTCIDLAGEATLETYGAAWGITEDELRAAQAYMVELHDADPKEQPDG